MLMSELENTENGSQTDFYNLNTSRRKYKLDTKSNTLRSLILKPATNRKNPLSNVFKEQNKKIYSLKKDFSVSFPKENYQKKTNFTKRTISRIINKINPVIVVMSRCLFNIFGVVLFLRLPRVFGMAGILFSCLAVLFCELLSFLTSLSLSAIATNGKIKEGGAYYLASRSLGPAFGLALGLQLFFANCISVALYLLGFSETLARIFKFNFPFSQQIISICVLLLIFIFCLLGSQLVFLLQLLFVLPALIISLGLVIFGFFKLQFFTLPKDYGLVFEGFSREIISNNFIIPSSKQFFEAIALFFPGTLGMMAGFHSSHTLKRPDKHLPAGTILATAFSTVTYLLIGLLLACSCKNEKLKLVPFAITEISISPPIVFIGSISTILSQAFTNYYISQDLLIAISKDDLGKLIKVFKGKNKKIFAPIVSFIVAFVFILPGEFDYIASLITSFCIITYSILNFACFTKSIQRAPEWRPTFRYYNQYVSLATACSYIVLMFFLHYQTAMVAIAITILLIGGTLALKPIGSWGVVGYSAFRNTIKSLQKTRLFKRAFRINALVLCGKNDKHLIKFTKELLCKGTGLVMFGKVFYGELDYEKPKEFISFVEKQQKWQENTKDLFVSVVAKDLNKGLQNIVQCSGFSYMSPNTVLFGFKNDWQINLNSAKIYINAIRSSLVFEKSVVIIRGYEDFEDMDQPENTILDIWWVEEDGGLCLLLPYIISLCKKMKRTKLRLIDIVDENSLNKRTVATAVKMLLKLRIKASVMQVKLDLVPNKTIQKCFIEKLKIKIKDYSLSKYTKNYLLVASKIQEFANESSTLFVTLPLPTANFGEREYFSLIDCLTKFKKRSVLVRGNNKGVLSFET